MSYLNTKPMLYGIKHHPIMNEIELVEDYPARIAQMLMEGQVDVGLIPVAATLKLNEWHIVGTHCIAADGAVASVCIFSEVPMSQIENVYLDYQSRTSVNLAKVLLKEYWKKDVVFIDASGEDFRDKIKGTTAGVVIGDRALEQRQHAPFIYDLAEAWKAHTGLPFVFAAWISTRPLPQEFIRKFDEAIALGLEHLDEVVAENPYPVYSLDEYYRKNINYRLDGYKKEGMDRFLQKINILYQQEQP